MKREREGEKERLYVLTSTSLINKSVKYLCSDFVEDGKYESEWINPFLKSTLNDE